MNDSPQRADSIGRVTLRQGWAGLLLAATWVISWFYGLNLRPLGEPDEGRYAEVAREMVASGDWLTPRLDGFNFFDKPALHYWGTAVAYSAFGITEWTARLWCALTGLLAMIAIGWAGKRLFGRQAGGFAAVMLGSTLLFAAAAHINTLDMGVTAFIAVGMSCFLVAQFDPSAAPIRSRLNVLMWIALGLAVMSKGLIGVVLPGMVLVVYMLWQRDWGLLGRLSLWQGTLVLVLLCSPWFIVMSYTHPGFFDYFFIREHFTRFLSSVDNRQKPIWFFPVIVIVGIFPWSMLLPFNRNGWQAIRADDPVQKFLWVWVAVVLVFFSLSHSKLPFYILPLFPALVLLLARAATILPVAALGRRLGVIALLGVSGAIAARVWPVGRHADVSAAAFHHNMTVLSMACLLIALAAFAGWQLLLRRAGKSSSRTAAIHVLALATLLGWQAPLLAWQPLTAVESAAPVAHLIAPRIGPYTEVFTVNMSLRGLPFYLQRLVTVVADQPDDIMPWVSSRPAGYIGQIEQFEQRWRTGHDEIAVMPSGTLARLQAAGLPFSELGRDGDYVVIAREARVQSPPSP
ncbi:MAG: phospholipid carrier-dependent glycosyltransferase [Rhodanobacter sp.]